MDEKRIEQEDLRPLSKAERASVSKALSERSEPRSNPTNDRIDFSDTVFDGTLIFDGCIFHLPVKFSRVDFLKHVQFIRSTFIESADFSESDFRGDLSTPFGDTNFWKSANFAAARFVNGTSFSGSFRGGVSFHRTKFLDGFILYELEIQSIYLAEVEVMGVFEIRDTSIFHKCSFNSVSVRQLFALLRCEFCSNVDFSSVHFDGAVHLSDTTFAGPAKFESATFKEFLKITGTTFSRQTDFSGVTFMRVADFSRTRFVGTVDFTAAKFEGRTSFSDVRFEEAPPKFYNAELHEDTKWVGARWPSAPKLADEADDHLRAYERLKLLMDDLKRLHDEQFFHRKELECREVIDGFPANIPSRIYRFFSAYGWSIERPLRGLAGTVLIGWLSLGAALCAQDNEPKMRCLGDALTLSISNTFSVLGLWRQVPEQVAQRVSENGFAQAVTVTQMIAGPVLLFFLLLAFRNRYRMR